ncbi:MAG: oligosaccharide flippase family protein [Bacteroidales bacterium]|nr:oligosaccharide flippase family protein [Bacteroidales bacterium]MDY6423415.1 oligosaccharide flippase family protein [Bacteroidales bacterium]
MSDIKRLASQTAVYGIPTIVGRFLNYFLVPLYTYNIATQDYGVVSELYAYVAFLMIILTYGMETAFFRFSQDYDKSKVYNTALFSLMVSTTLFLLITFLSLSPICSAMQYSNHKTYIALFLIILALDALRAIPYALLRRENMAKRFAFIKTVDIFSNILFNLFFIALCPILYDKGFYIITSWFNPNDLVLYIFISNCLASFISFILLIPQFSQFRFNIDFKVLKRMLVYGFPVMIGGLAGMVNETFDRIALKHLVSIPDYITDTAKIAEYKMSQIGIYGACYKLSIVISLFIQAFKFAAEPFFFSKMKQQDAKKSYSEVMTAFVIFLCFIFLIVMGYIDLFQYFMGKDYRIGIMVVPILLMANIFLGIYYNLSIWYKVSDKTKYGAYIALIGAAITLIGNYFLVPILGYKGAAWTTLICYFVISLLCYLIGQKFYPVAYKVKRIAFYILFSLGLYSVMYYLQDNIQNIMLRLAINTALIIVYLILCYILDFKKIIKQK